MAALLIDPRDAQAHAAIGQLYLDAGRDAEAVTAFNRALELMPDGYETRYALATALHATRQDRRGRTPVRPVRARPPREARRAPAATSREAEPNDREEARSAQRVSNQDGGR